MKGEETVAESRPGSKDLSRQENTLVGADLAWVASNFVQPQLANQATLNATAKVLSLPTLLDYPK